MGSIIGWLVGRAVFGKTITERTAPVIAHIGLFIVILALCGGVVAWIRSDAVKDFRQKAEIRQGRREVKADNNLQTHKDTAAATAEQRKQEMAHATRNIPDQAPSARQHAIACNELRREAQQRRKPVPTCYPAAASGRA